MGIMRALRLHLSRLEPAMSRSRSVRAWTLAVASATVFVVSASADHIVRAVAPGPQDPQNPPTPQTPQEQEPTGGRGGRGNQQQGPPAPRPYAQVITAAAKTDD